LIELLPVLLIGALALVFLFLRNLRLTSDNGHLRKTVTAQNKELNELRELFLAMDAGDEMQELLERVHISHEQRELLESLRYVQLER